MNDRSHVADLQAIEFPRASSIAGALTGALAADRT